MTSACGVVESTKGKQENDFKTTFWYQNLKARGDAFEEYYLNLSADAVVKVKPSNSLYTVGDSVPAGGESYHYPSDFDIIILRDKVVVQVRNQQITAIQQTASYQYEGVSIINGRGYEVTAKNEQEVTQFLEEYDETDSDTLAQFYNKWLKFSTYRSVIFTNNFWKQ